LLKHSIGSWLQIAPFSAFSSKDYDYYDVLGTKKDATDEEVKHAYFRKCKEFHPDKHHGNDDMHKQFIKINEAYQVLNNPVTRRQYDESLRMFKHPRKHFRKPVARHSYPKHWYEDSYHYKQKNDYMKMYGSYKFGRGNQVAVVLFAVIIYAAVWYLNYMRQNRKLSFGHKKRIEDIKKLRNDI